MCDITCDICADLLPLVRDGIASADSAAAVARHLEQCPACRALCSGQLPPPADPARAFGRLRRQLRLWAALLMLFGIFFGLSLTAGSGVFYNSLIMPLIGALGYLLFGWRALCEVPLLLFLVHGATNFFGLLRGAERLDLWSLLFWTALYSLFALVGALIAGLLHYALRKEK